MRWILAGSIGLVLAWAFLGCSSSHGSSGGTTAGPGTATGAALAAATPGQPYTGDLTASNTSGTSTWVVVSGALPAGIVLAPDGALSGTPTAAAASATFQAQVTSGAGTSVLSFAIQVISTSTITTASTLPSGFVGQAYDETFASSGTPAGTWAVASGVSSLPSGLTLSVLGVLTGTPSATGVFNFTLSETDAASNGVVAPTSTKNFSLEIDPAGTPVALAIATPTPPAATLSVPYSDSFQSSGGTGPVTWAVSFSSALPPGLSLSTSGFLSGTPTAQGSYSFTLVATDSTVPTRQTASGTIQLTVN